MSLDFFPTKFINGVLCEAISFKNMTRVFFSEKQGRYLEDVPNPDYVPGAMVNLATVHGKKILSSMGKSFGEDGAIHGLWPLEEFKAAYRDAMNSCETSARYNESFTDMFKVCEDVGATHIMCL